MITFAQTAGYLKRLQIMPRMFVKIGYTKISKIDVHYISKVHKISFLFLDDDLSDSTPAMSPKRRKFFDIIAVDEDQKNEKYVSVVDCDEKNDDDWMPSLKVSEDEKKFEEDPTLKKLRLRKQELASYAKSAEEVLHSV